MDRLMTVNAKHNRNAMTRKYSVKDQAFLLGDPEPA
jgi:hypothetical protein